MIFRRLFFSYLIAASLFLVTDKIGAQTLGMTDIGPYSISDPIMLWSLSAQGSQALGTAGTGTTRRAIGWNATNGVFDLGLLPGLSTSGLVFSYAFGTALSADGTTAVGKVSDSGGVGQAFYWTQTSGMHGLAYLHGGISSVAYAVSQNGAVIAGTANDGSDGQIEKAVLWSGPNKTIQTLGLGRITDDGLNASPYVAGLSARGTVIVGSATNNTDTYAWMWTPQDSNIRKFMPSPFYRGYSDAAGLSLDGTTIVGTVSASQDQNHLQAYAYSIPTGTLRLLGVLNNSTGTSVFSYGLAINQDGSVVVGQASDGHSLNRETAFRWTASQGMQSLDQWLLQSGLTVSASSAYPLSANSISADGCVVGGQLSNGHGFIAKGCQGPGLIDVDAFHTALTTSHTALLRTHLAHSDLVVNGLNGHPLAFPLKPGQISIALSGDFGTAHQNSAQSVGEFSFAYGLEHHRLIKIGIGYSDLQSSLSSTPASTFKGAFLTPEFVSPLGTSPFYVSLLGFYEIGDLTSHRHFTDAGIMAIAQGRTSARSYGARLRVDWVKALEISDWSLTPYASLTSLRTDLGGYLETAPSFPVMWHRSDDRTTLVRIGLDSLYPVNDHLQLTTTVETIHRLEHWSRIAAGRNVDLGDFVTAPTPLQQTWLRFGIGAHLTIGPGIASLMINKSTQDFNAAWASLSYRLIF